MSSNQVQDGYDVGMPWLEVPSDDGVFLVEFAGSDRRSGIIQIEQWRDTNGGHTINVGAVRNWLLVISYSVTYKGN